MSLRFLKEHLPWMIPTAAIVAAATGLIDISPKDDRSFASTGYDTAAVSRNAMQNPAALAQPSAVTPPVDAIAAVIVQPEPAPVQVRPAVATPLPEPEPAAVTPQPVSLETQDKIAATEFFANAQARLEADNSCVEDLRVLAENARIYFPTGGLSGEDTGLAQARLIGLVAQNCPTVEIVVEGHSDPSGDPDYNLKLSQQRADAVLQRIAAAGIDVSRFRAVGLGSKEPSGVTGTEANGYYDRRVEFEVRAMPRSTGATVLSQAPLSDCALALKDAVDQTKLFYSPRSITPPSDGLPAVIKLAAAASDCPDARLRVIGQYSDELGSGETPATARLRAVALMSSLVGTGFAPEKIIIAARSQPTALAGQPGTSKRRIDFDVIMDN